MNETFLVCMQDVGLHEVSFGLKTSLHINGEHNGTKTELYRINTKIQGLVPFMIISIVVHADEANQFFNQFLSNI